MEPQYIVQRYAIFFILCVKLGDSATTTHGKLQQALGDDAMSREQDFLWQNPCWKWAVQRTTISNTDRWQHSTGKRTCWIWSKINSQNDCWWSEHEPGIRSFDNWLKKWEWEKFVPRWCPEISDSNSRMYGWVQFLISKCVTVMPQPPYSPELAPCEFFISKIKIGSERTSFWVSRRHPELCNAVLKRHPIKCVPGML